MTVRSRVVTYTQPGLPHVPRPVHPVLTRHDPLGCFYCFINFKKKIRTLPNILEHHGLNIKQEKISILYFFFLLVPLDKSPHFSHPIYTAPKTPRPEHPSQQRQHEKKNEFTRRATLFTSEDGRTATNHQIITLAISNLNKSAPTG